MSARKTDKLAGPIAGTTRGALELGRPAVGIVGPCGAGKSTLMRALRARGISAREIAQEHSGVPAMWQRITAPRHLVYLNVSRETAERRLERAFSPDEWEELTARLAHARAHADLIVETDDLPPDEVAERVLAFLQTVENPLHNTL